MRNIPSLQELPVSTEQLLRAVLAVLGIVSAVALTVVSAQHSDGSSHADGRGDSYVDPDFETGQQLEEIRTDFFTAIAQLRIDDTLPPVSLDPELQRTAQAQAEGNAVTGEQPPLDAGEKTAQVSAHLPVEQASGYEFFELFTHSPEHMEVLLDDRHRDVGIGVAYGRGDVWVVVAFAG